MSYRFVVNALPLYATLLGNNFGKENSYIQLTPNINDRINVKLREYQSIINSSIKVTSILDIPV